MITTITLQPVYSTLKNGKRGRIIGYEKISEERNYSPGELDEHGNVKPKTKKEERAEAEKFIMTFTGMSLDDYARKILYDYNQELQIKFINYSQGNNYLWDTLTPDQQKEIGIVLNDRALRTAGNVPIGNCEVL